MDVGWGEQGALRGLRAATGPGGVRRHPDHVGDAIPGVASEPRALTPACFPAPRGATGLSRKPIVLWGGRWSQVEDEAQRLVDGAHLVGGDHSPAGRQPGG